MTTKKAVKKAKKSFMRIHIYDRSQSRCVFTQLVQWPLVKDTALAISLLMFKKHIKSIRYTFKNTKCDITRLAQLPKGNVDDLSFVKEVEVVLF